jgi:outer membrane protein
MLFAGLLQPLNGAHAETPARVTVTESACVAAEYGASQEESRWFGRIGILGALYDSHARIAANGNVIPRATANVSDDLTVIFDVGYTVSSLGELGKVRYGPLILTGTYGWQWGAFRPYGGLGAAYAIILNDFDGSVSKLHVHNNWGFVLQAGIEYRLSRRWDLFLDYKRLWLDVKAEGFLANGAPVRALVTLDPHLISSGVKFHF